MVTCESEEVVGRRVAIGPHLGTVRYVGPIPSAKGTWLGIEWDDPNRGKHNGTYDGHVYFETRHPKSGSFVHIEKADFGCSFVSAMKERYGSNQLTLTAEELQNLQRSMNAAHLEMVGFDKVKEKQSCFSDLDVICLHNHQVCCAGDELASMGLGASEVDLSLNLLTSWNQVAEIARSIPSIRSLNLSFNRLTLPEDPEELRDAFGNLFHLVMGHMAYSWAEILTCVKMWPNIQDLQVPFNNITSINLPENILRNLTHLDLEGNSISDWEEINKLGLLEKLEFLNLCDLGLTNINLPPSQNLFKNLQNLLLSDNKIDKWEYVAQLDRLPQLKELKFSQNPVLENLSAISIHVRVIARIGTLEVLNRLKITKEERRGAELEYIQKYKKEWFSSEKSEDSRSIFLLNHPRFPVLVKEYGIAEEKLLAKSYLCTDDINIKLTCMGQTVTKTFPIEARLVDVMRISRSEFNIDQRKIPLLSYCSTENPDITEDIIKLYQTLRDHYIEDGDEIIINFKNT